MLTKLVAIILFAVVFQDSPQTPQDKRGVGIQPSPTPTPASQVSPVYDPNKPDLVMQSGHADYVRDVEFSPDGKLILAASWPLHLIAIAPGSAFVVGAISDGPPQ